VGEGVEVGDEGLADVVVVLGENGEMDEEGEARRE
jgi:hypothetical protein